MVLKVSHDLVVDIFTLLQKEVIWGWAVSNVFNSSYFLLFFLEILTGLHEVQ